MAVGGGGGRWAVGGGGGRRPAVAVAVGGGRWRWEIAAGPGRSEPGGGAVLCPRFGRFVLLSRRCPAERQATPVTSQMTIRLEREGEHPFLSGGVSAPSHLWSQRDTEHHRVHHQPGYRGNHQSVTEESSNYMLRHQVNETMFL